MATLSTPKTLQGWLAIIATIITFIGVTVTVTLYVSKPQMEIQSIRQDSEGTSDKLDTLIESIEGIKDGQEEIRNDIRDLKGDVDALKGDVKSLKGTVDTLKEDTSELKTDVQWLKLLLPSTTAKGPPG
ncbi:MAG: DUF2312 domain-containing protein [Gammaproteobacteria bacterium]|nr:DUF2312 domain-containing protein [Gammaproteobacteria bacterium]